jgi:hypothetical protein
MGRAYTACSWARTTTCASNKAISSPTAMSTAEALASAAIVGAS